MGAAFFTRISSACWWMEGPWRAPALVLCFPLLESCRDWGPQAKDRLMLLFSRPDSGNQSLCWAGWMVFGPLYWGAESIVLTAFCAWDEYSLILTSLWLWPAAPKWVSHYSTNCTTTTPACKLRPHWLLYPNTPGGRAIAVVGTLSLTWYSKVSTTEECWHQTFFLLCFG